MATVRGTVDCGMNSLLWLEHTPDDGGHFKEMEHGAPPLLFFWWDFCMYRRIFGGTVSYA